MDSGTVLRTNIVQAITQKSNLGQKVFDNTFCALTLVKEILHEMDSELDDELDGKIDERVRIEYRDRGKFEAQIQIASDILIFSMQTSVFNFPAGHPVWDTGHASEDRNNAYCGIINIYNFLSDSFKYNRVNDEGYLIGRIFVNRNEYVFTEGSPKLPLGVDSFGSAKLAKETVKSIVESAIECALNFDALIPPYEISKTVTVEQFNTRFESTKTQTGKRLGYGFDKNEI